MAHSGSDADAFVTHGTRPRSVVRASRRLGLALLGAAGPAVVTAFLVAVTRPGTAGPLAWVGEAMATPLVGGTGLGWAFHVAAVTGLAGLWVVGFALVVEGYFGVE
ncbi:hypothetical protein C475_14633 [Halosimplex carlsbadense 2-9-1]|uniref:Uncharacterized protein n=1 Tax=Halosimplex carlsbadense 2-9-1 TaxID=797114 RepID=M0CLN2_9EURY|nr:hypothetical protein [Halosimplex carlsbadense]ELZ23518.1 hypothetical protein C475_14633 [Halosimplex carlsbadense 2-9-1]